jgi:uncharacterized damage-inducible protein DinB
MLKELEAETPATRRVLERLPADRFEWRPHPKSLSAGQLAQHVAAIPGSIARMVQGDGVDMSTRGQHYASCGTKDALLATLDASVASVRQFLEGLDEAQATAPFRLTNGDREILTMPRLGVMRTMCFNHWYHHRGELVVYLRMLDVPVPVVYGRSADENPFVRPAGVGPI